MLFKLDLAGSFLLSLVIIIVEASFDYKTGFISHINITNNKHFHRIYITYWYLCIYILEIAYFIITRYIR